MMTKYLEPGIDPEELLFKDYPPKDRPKNYELGDPCPRCKRHGGWNLKLNAYPLHDYPDTPENRHAYAHLRSSCSACWGWGYLQPGQTCAHSWKDSKTVGKCLHEWVCEKCGQTITIDSSD